MNIIATVLTILMRVLTPNQEVAILDGIFDKHYGTVVSQITEGYSESDDIYAIEISGVIYEVISDDLCAGDLITAWFYNGKPIRVLYDWR